jgi:hypothetical protein
VGRYIREFKDQDLYIITDENGNAIDVVKGKDKANEMLAPLEKKQEYENKFNKIINKEKSNAVKDKLERQKLIDRYKSSGEVQREEYEKAMDEYFTVSKNLSDAITKYKDDNMDYESEDADLISNIPRLKNLQKNKVKAMTKAWEFAQLGERDYRDEAIDAFGNIRAEDYGEFTPSQPKNIKEYRNYKSKFGQSVSGFPELLSNKDIDPSKVHSVRRPDGAPPSYYTGSGETDTFGDTKWDKVDPSTLIPPPRKTFTEDDWLRLLAKD